MATEKELSSFLEAVERRAFKQAVYAVRKDEAALDIVQDAMIKLAEKYGALLYPFFLDGVATLARLNQRDGVHPNAEGVSVIVQGILPKVEELVTRVRAKSRA